MLNRLSSEKPAEGSSLCLLSDISGVLPSAPVLDFAVAGFQLGPRKWRLAVLVDDYVYCETLEAAVQLPPLSRGHHLLRAFVIDDRTGLCAKTPSCYVEAEFFVLEWGDRVAANFLFGQPSICLLSLTPTADKQVVVDYFVHNCVVAPGDDAFKVKVYVDGLAYGNPVNDWVSLSMGVPPTARIRLALVNPLGEELARPAFNCAERQPAEERAERAALGGPDDSSSARGGKK